MEEFARLVFGVSVFCVLGFSMFYMVRIRRLCRHLELEHPTTWEQLGKPGPLANQSIGNSLAVVGFLLSKSYRDIDDPAVSKLGGACRFLLIAVWLFMGCWTLSIFLQI